MTDTDLQNALKSVQDQAPLNSRWTHIKSNHDYVVRGYAILEATARPAILYSRDIPDAPTWARDAEEFLDGRFRRV